MLTHPLRASGVYVIVAFDGTGMSRDWRAQQLANADNVRQIYKHIRARCTPPHKQLWLPTAGMYAAIAMALRLAGADDQAVQVHVTQHNHLDEVVALAHTRHADALLAGGGVYTLMLAAAQNEHIPFYLAASLKLTYKSKCITVVCLLQMCPSCSWSS
jgi:hypothetical protein